MCIHTAVERVASSAISISLGGLKAETTYLVGHRPDGLVMWVVLASWG